MKTIGIGVSSSAQPSVLMASGSPIKTITKMSTVADTSEVTNQSGECMVSNAGYNYVCYVNLFIGIIRP